MGSNRKIILVFFSASVLLFNIILVNESFRTTEYLSVKLNTFITQPSLSRKVEAITDKETKNMEGSLKKGICHRLLSFSKGSLPVREEFLMECNLIVLARAKTTVLPILEKLYRYLIWSQSIYKRLQNGEDDLLNKIKVLHFQRNQERQIGIGGVVSNLRYAFLLSLFSRRYFIADLTDECNGSISLWKPNAIPWKVPNQFYKDVNLRDEPHKKIDCSDPFKDDKLVLFEMYHTFGMHNQSCIDRISQMALFRRLPQEDRVQIFIASLMTHLLVDFSNVARISTQEEAFKFKYGVPKKYAALHIRTGIFGDGRIEIVKNGRNMTRFSWSKVSWEEKITCTLNFMKENMIMQPLVLVTDSVQLKRYAKNIYGDSKIVSQEIEPSHIEKDALEGKEISQERCVQNVIDNLVDISLMAHSDMLVFSVSNFPTLSSNIGLLPYRKQFCCQGNCRHHPIIRF